MVSLAVFREVEVRGTQRADQMLTGQADEGAVRVMP
jgi:hypothetical protein